jgi:hypothetical protein
MQNVNNLSVQNFFFPLHDEILFQGHGKVQKRFTTTSIGIHGLSKILLNTKSQIDFD